MAFIESINNNQFTAKLDSGELITIPKSYKHIDYGYATTVHKGQGMTVDNASILIDSKYWDRFLSFVAMTRHRIKLTLYADQQQHPDLNALSKTLSRSNTKDNVIDWPLDLAIRHGFDSDSLIGKVINHVAGVGNKIKEKYNYIVHYEAYARQKMAKEHYQSKQAIRAVAKKIADYLDEQVHYSALRNEITKQAKQLKVEPSTLQEFKSLYEQSVVRDKKAHVIWTKHREQLSDIALLKPHQKEIQKAAERHERYLVIADLAKHKTATPLSEKQIESAGIIDLQQDKIHVMRLAPQFNKTPNELFQEIDQAQKTYRKMIFNQLKKDHPVLMEYDKLCRARSNATGFKAEQLDDLLLVKTREITQNKTLYEQLQQDLPKFVRSLFLKIKNHELELSREQ